jgi:plasmid stabilization system protein ParE
VATITLMPEIFDDFDRILDHLTRYEVENPSARINEIIDAIQILRDSPFIGRPVSGGKRELVIGSRARGYVALYRHIVSVDTVFVLAVRHQREDGYRHGI